MTWTENGQRRNSFFEHLPATTPRFNATSGTQQLEPISLTRLYLKLGVGNAWAGQMTDIWDLSTKLNVFDFDSLGRFGGELPIGSTSGMKNQLFPPSATSLFPHWGKKPKMSKNKSFSLNSV